MRVLRPSYAVASLRALSAGNKLRPGLLGCGTENRSQAFAVEGREGSVNLCRICGERECSPTRRKCRRCSQSPHRCAVDGCDLVRYSRPTGFCRGHFRAFQETGDPLSRRRYTRQQGCNWPLCSKRARRNGWCGNHSAVVYRMQSECPVHEPRVDSERLRGLLDKENHSEIARRSGVPLRTIVRIANQQEEAQFATADRIVTALYRHVDEVLA